MTSYQMATSQESRRVLCRAVLQDSTCGVVAWIGTPPVRVMSVWPGGARIRPGREESTMARPDGPPTADPVRVRATRLPRGARRRQLIDRKSTRLNSSHVAISYAVFCLKK